MKERKIIGYEIHTKKKTFTGIKDFILDEEGFVLCLDKNEDKFYIKKKLVKFIFPVFE